MRMWHDNQDTTVVIVSRDELSLLADDLSDVADERHKCSPHHYILAIFFMFLFLDMHGYSRMLMEMLALYDCCVLTLLKDTFWYEYCTFRPIPPTQPKIIIENDVSSIFDSVLSCCNRPLDYASLSKCLPAVTVAGYAISYTRHTAFYLYMINLLFCCLLPIPRRSQNDIISNMMCCIIFHLLF